MSVMLLCSVFSKLGWGRRVLTTKLWEIFETGPLSRALADQELAVETGWELPPNPWNSRLALPFLGEVSVDS